MAEENNSLLKAILMLERVKPMMHEQDRAPIDLHHLRQIKERIVLTLNIVAPITQSAVITAPLIEVINLIDTMSEDSTFVETTDEAKKVLCSKVDDAMDELYLFAGKYYMDHEFNYTMTLDAILRKIVDVNLAHGFFFGMEGAT